MNKRLIVYLKRVLFLIFSSFSLVKASYQDVAFMLRHADYELKNSSLFQEGLYDLTLIFNHGLYQSRPALENKFINLVKYAEGQSTAVSLEVHAAIQSLSDEVFELYRGTRYALDIGLISGKKWSKEVGCEKSKKKQKVDQGSLHKKEKKTENRLERVGFPQMYGRSGSRRKGSKKKKSVVKKKKVTKQKKEKKPKEVKVKKLTKKQQAALNSGTALISSVATLSEELLPIDQLVVEAKNTLKKKTPSKKKATPKSEVAQDLTVSQPKKKGRPKKKQEQSAIVIL